MRVINLETIVQANRDLSERMERKNWRVLYDRGADMLIICGELPESSEYIPIDDEGFMLRMKPGEDKIYGFGIENFRKSFAQRHHDFRLVFMPLTNPWKFGFLRMILGTVRTLTDARSQRSEVAEYIASEAVFGSATA